VLDSPVPFAEGFRKEVELALARMGEEANPEAAAKLYDYEEIAVTIASNFDAAKRHILNPVVKAA
jgi:hypothetical protein